MSTAIINLDDSALLYRVCTDRYSYRGWCICSLNIERGEDIGFVVFFFSESRIS